MKKHYHQEFYYTLSELSGFKHVENLDSSTFIFIRDSELKNAELNSFLHKIISALPLKNTDNENIICCEDKMTYPARQLFAHNVKNFISFGITPSQLELQGFDQPHHIYQIQDYKFLFAHSIQHYKEGTDKNILWQLLQQMFDIKSK